MTATTTPVRPRVRCAIYCRKSSEEGLDQAFNSLDAQRASGEAYIASQAGQGWECLPDLYMDGGFSGANTERPALARLLADIEAGKVDAVITYKLDRLTRSIRDFAHLMDTFERRGVALVSVTQSLDTASSMGRLMLHILLSFAQFERETTAERTRDKIAMSRQKGRWTGGRPILGFEIVDSCLKVSPIEAATVRQIFALYIDKRSLASVVQILSAKGTTNKRWSTRAGRSVGGHAISKSRLAEMLANPLYVGKVPHKGKLYDGIHEAIVSPEVFARAQAILAENRRGAANQQREGFGGILKGLLTCGCCGGSMVHSITRKKGGESYRYYVCMARQAMGNKPCVGGRLPAEQIEQFVVEKVRPSLAEPKLATLVLDIARERTNERLRDLEALKSMHQQDIDRTEGAMLGASQGAERARLIAERDRAARALADVDRQISLVRDQLVDRPRVESGLGEFTSLWSSMSPAEQRQLLGLLVSRITLDGRSGQLTIDLHEEPEELKRGDEAA